MTKNYLQVCVWVCVCLKVKEADREPRDVSHCWCQEAGHDFLLNPEGIVVRWDRNSGSPRCQVYSSTRLLCQGVWRRLTCIWTTRMPKRFCNRWWKVENSFVCLLPGWANVTHVMTSVSSPGSLSSPSTNTEVLVKLWTVHVCPSSMLNLSRHRKWSQPDLSHTVSESYWSKVG